VKFFSQCELKFKYLEFNAAKNLAFSPFSLTVRTGPLWERDQRLRDSEFEKDDDELQVEPVRSKRVTAKQYTAAQRMRDSIAEQMWTQYSQHSKKRKRQR